MYTVIQLKSLEKHMNKKRVHDSSPNNIESVPGEHNALIQCWWIAGPLSSMLDQYHTSTGSTSRVCWVTTPRLDIEKINIDIKISIIKPIHACWLIAAIERITLKTYCIIKGFVQAGLKKIRIKKNISINLCVLS